MKDIEDVLKYLHLEYKDLNDLVVIKHKLRKRYKYTHPDMPTGSSVEFQKTKKLGEWVINNREDIKNYLDYENSYVIVSKHGVNFNNVSLYKVNKHELRK